MAGAASNQRARSASPYGNAEFFCQDIAARRLRFHCTETPRFGWIGLIADLVAAAKTTYLGTMH